MKLDNLPLVAILGPTGSGKSQLALRLAEILGGQIVNCDSVQVYRGLDVGSAKLSFPERRGVPHHLIDIINLDEELTAGEYARLARPVIRGIHESGCVPIVVGGTGFYFRALIDGLSPAPTRDEKLRTRFVAISVRRPSALHKLLANRDGEAAKRIHPNDHQKIIRAIELSMSTGRPASDTQKLPRDAFEEARVLKLGLAPDRHSLRDHLDARVEQMFQSGLLEETEALLKAGFLAKVKPLQSLGYKQAVEVATAERPLGDAIRECQVRTRRYAKRQMTWFRAEPDIKWLPGFGTDENVQKAAIAEAASFLAATKTQTQRSNELPIPSRAY